MHLRVRSSRIYIICVFHTLGLREWVKMWYLVFIGCNRHGCAGISRTLVNKDVHCEFLLLWNCTFLGGRPNVIYCIRLNLIQSTCPVCGCACRYLSFSQSAQCLQYFVLQQILQTWSRLLHCLSINEPANQTLSTTKHTSKLVGLPNKRLISNHTLMNERWSFIIKLQPVSKVHLFKTQTSSSSLQFRGLLRNSFPNNCLIPSSKSISCQAQVKSNVELGQLSLSWADLGQSQTLYFIANHVCSRGHMSA